MSIGLDAVHAADRIELTAGDWKTEVDSCNAFDDALERCGLFRVYSECWGYPLQPRLGQDLQRMRIDRILSPKPKLRDAGWTIGPFGVELKRSGEKIGKPLAQAGDYLRCAWPMGDGFNAMLDFVTIWPVRKQHGTVASIMMQNRIGAIEQTDCDLLKITCGEQVLLAIDRLGEIRSVNCREFGRKAGNRG